MPNVLQNGAEPGTDAIWGTATAKAARQRPGEMAICRACGRLTQIYARGVCRADYDRYQAGEIQEHVLAPPIPPITSGLTVPLAHPVPGVITLDVAPAGEAPAAPPPPAAPATPKRARAPVPRQLAKRQAATAPPEPSPEAPSLAVTEGPKDAATLAPKPPRRRPLDRLIAELGTARTARAALDTKIAALETEIRARWPADLLPTP